MKECRSPSFSSILGGLFHGTVLLAVKILVVVVVVEDLVDFSWSPL